MTFSLLPAQFNYYPLDSTESYSGFTDLLDLSWKVPHCLQITQPLDLLVTDFLWHKGLSISTRQQL